MTSPTSSNFPDTSESNQTTPATAGTTGGSSDFHSPTSTLRPNSTQHRPGPSSDEISSASIKSGVIGFSQGGQDSHAALGNNHPAQTNLGGSQLAGGGGGQQSRTFPLAGGVTGDRPIENTTTSKFEPGSKERDDAMHKSQGREGLASAAAAAAASSAIPGHRHEPATSAEQTGHQGHHPDALAGAITANENTRPSPAAGHEDIGAAPTSGIDPTASNTRSVHPIRQDHTGTASTSGINSTASNTPSIHPIGQEHTETPSTSGKDHTASDHSGPGLFKGLFTKGPHPTDAGNMFDPHVPGAFPDPTPLEERSEPSFNTSTGTTPAVAAGGQHGLRHTGTLDDPQTRSAHHIEEPTTGNHHGRDAAIAGGLGAAGAGAYTAAKHQHEPQSTGGNIFPTEKSPYSSTSIDPRVDTKPAALEKQRYDASNTNKPQARDPTLTSGLPIRTKDEKSHNHGRDAALVGGAGAATTAGLYASQRANEPDSGPASDTIGPHKTNIANVLDPRVQPDPSLQKHHSAAPTADDPASSTVGPHKSNVANVMDPKVLPDPQKQKAQPKEQHHYGRDAAVVGGTGAAGYGAYEAAKSYGDHPSTQPAASIEEQRYDPTAPTHAPVSPAMQGTHDPSISQHHYGRDAAAAGGLGAAGAGAYGASRHNDTPQQPTNLQQYPSTETHQYHVGSQQHPPTQASQQPPLSETTEKPQHHYGRDAAVAGGLGAAGAGVYGAAHGYDHTQQPQVIQQQYPPTQASSSVHYPQDSVNDPKAHNQHQKRDAAALGAAGAAVGAGGAFAYSQHDAEKDREAAQKANEQAFKHQHQHFAAQQKEQEKAFHEQQKHQNKLAAAEEKKHHKEAEKEHEDDHDGENKEKKHHLFGFLHRDKDKSKNSPDSSPRASIENKRHSKEYATGAGAAGLGGAAAYEAGHDRHDSDGRHRLHKDPPKGHPAREALEQQQHQPGQQRMGVDGPIGIPNQISGDR
jgi:hypothetical protein